MLLPFVRHRSHPPGDSPLEALQKAFALAYFLHADRELSLRIAASALAKLEVAATAQTKRLYYRGTARSGAKRAAFRTKVTLADMPLLQRLVYLESEPHERKQESDPGRARLTEEDWVIRFVKHLVQITVKRNAFYVCLGASRLLHNYTTRETGCLYEALLDNPDRIKDDDYYRSRKLVLMRELRDRFGTLLRTFQGPHGEERFQARPSEDGPRWVFASLNAFVPWNTACRVPAGFDARQGGIPGLSAETFDEEQKREVERMHAILHPECFRRLTAGLGLASPARRLEVPRFFLSRDSEDQGPRGDREHPPDLSEEEIAAVGRYLDDEAARRHASGAGLLRVLVDGKERARFDPALSPSVRLEVESEAELLEVRARRRGEEVLLCTYSLHDGSGNARKGEKASIRLEGGQRVFFTFEPSRDGAGELTGWLVEITYRETKPLRAASLLLHRVFFSLGGVRPRALRLQPALALAISLCIAAGLLFSLRTLRPRPVEGPAGTHAQGRALTLETTPTSPARLARAGETSLPPKEGQVPRPAAPRPTSEESVRIARDETLRPPQVGAPGRHAQERSDTEGTRGLRSQAPRADLRSISRIFVEPATGEPEGEKVRELLVPRLRASRRLAVSETREGAEAVLVLLVRRAGHDGKRISAVARLIGPSGEPLWAAGHGLGYSGSPSEVADSVAKDLVTAIEAGGRKK